MRTGIFIFGVILAVLGIFLAGTMYGQVQACGGTITKIAGFFDPSVKANCGTISFLLNAGYGLIGIGVLLLLIGLFLKKEK